MFSTRQRGIAPQQREREPCLVLNIGRYRAQRSDGGHTEAIRFRDGRHMRARQVANLFSFHLLLLLSLLHMRNAPIGGPRRKVKSIFPVSPLLLLLAMNRPPVARNRLPLHPQQRTFRDPRWTSGFDPKRSSTTAATSAGPAGLTDVPSTHDTPAQERPPEGRSRAIE